MAQTHWKKLINPDYIGAYALDPGKDLTVQISQVRREMVTGADGKKEECTVAYLKDQKPMILNVTNCKTIEKLYGPYIEDWAGKHITLYAANSPKGSIDQDIYLCRLQKTDSGRRKQECGGDCSAWKAAVWKRTVH